MSGGEGGDDDLVKGEGKGQQAASQQGGGQVGQYHIAEGLPAVGAQIQRGFDQALAGAAKAGQYVIKHDHHAEGGVADDQRQHARCDAQMLEAGQQGEACDDTRQGNGQHQQHGEGLLAEEAVAPDGQGGQGAQQQRQQGGSGGNLEREPDGLQHIGALGGGGKPLEGETLQRKAEGGTFAVEGVEGDHQQGQVQQDQPAPGQQLEQG